MYKWIDGFLFKSERSVMVPVSSLDPVNDDTCVICMRYFASQTPMVCNKPFVKRVKCAHVYHADCLNRWLEKNTTCPMCRFPLFYHVDNRELMKRKQYSLVPVTANHWNIE